MYTVAKNTKTISFALMAIGLIALIFGFSTDAHRAWPSLMINNYFFLNTTCKNLSKPKYFPVGINAKTINAVISIRFLLIIR